MDWPALTLSLWLSLATVLILLPLSLLLARALAFHRFPLKGFAEALIALPLVLPPTVLGYYLLTSFGRGAPLGDLYTAVTGGSLAFSFEGLLLASIIFNLPFAVQPLQRALEAIPRDLRPAAWVSGLSPWATFWRIELPLAWPGLLTALVLTFAHTMGEFGVVLMVGGSIPGETKTMAIAIYDRVQAFDDRGAHIMAAFLLLLSFFAIGLVYLLGNRIGPRHG